MTKKCIHGITPQALIFTPLGAPLEGGTCMVNAGMCVGVVRLINPLNNKQRWQATCSESSELEDVRTEVYESAEGALNALIEMHVPLQEALV